MRGLIISSVYCCKTISMFNIVSIEQFEYKPVRYFEKKILATI